MKPYFLLAFIIITVAIGATGDAFMLTGDKLWGHSVTALETALLISGMVLFRLTVKDLFLYLVIYTCIRIGIFDFAFNFVADLGILYVGDTSLWDKVVKMVLPMGMIFIRILFMSLGIGLIFKFFKN